MPQQPRSKPNLVERFLYGPNGDPMRQQKAGDDHLFQVDPYQNLMLNNWSAPTVPMYPAGTYGGRIQYAVEAGDLIDNSAVMACMNWLMRNLPKATPRVVVPGDDGEVPVPDHPFTKMLKRPNPFYSGTQLLRATVCSYYWDGNAYWRKIRNGAGQVIQYWYEPHWTIRPVRLADADFVTKYQVWRRTGGTMGQWFDVPVEDIVHFRWSFSAYNGMLGMAPLASALRDVFTDNEASRYSATMFRNLGVVGGIVSSGSEDLPINNVDKLKAELQALTTGDERGKWLVEDVPLNFAFPASDPTKMSTRENRKISEERVAALLGVPASVAGLGAGLDRNTYSNADDAIRRAYDDNIIPTLASWAEEIDIQTLPDFTSKDAETLEFDTSHISVLRGNVEAREQSTADLYSKGVITRAQAKIRIGLKPETDGSDDVYFTKDGPIGQDVADTSAPAETLPGLAGRSAPLYLNGNGNGHAQGKAAKKPQRELVEAAIASEVKAEIKRVYDEAADKA